MKLRLEMCLDNAAFCGSDRDHPQYRDGRAVGYVLHEVANNIGGTGLVPGDYGDIRDINGNDIGTWKVTR